jgi:hypothetical protein
MQVVEDDAFDVARFESAVATGRAGLAAETRDDVTVVATTDGSLQVLDPETLRGLPGRVPPAVPRPPMSAATELPHPGHGPATA